MVFTLQVYGHFQPTGTVARQTISMPQLTSRKRRTKQKERG
jgi:hypothetical protein